MVYDLRQQGCFVFAGYSGNTGLTDPWRYGLPQETEAGEFWVRSGSVVSGSVEELRDPDHQCLTLVSDDQSTLEVEFATIIFGYPIAQSWLKSLAYASDQVWQVGEMYNWQTGQWDTLSTGPVSTKPETSWTGLSFPADRYQGPYGLARARLRFFGSQESAAGFTVSFDHVAWYAAR
jgi:hypothetical protein